jgi:hypothetical protein
VVARVADASFEELQASLGTALAANGPGSGVEHVLVVLPSYSVGDSLLAHYAEHIAALEHRYLLAALVLGRIESCHLVFVTCAPPEPDVLRYYASLLLPEQRGTAWNRLRVLAVPDDTARPVAAKLLDRPDLIEQLRTSVGGLPVFIEPWNVTDAEVEVALALGAPIYGTAPSLRRLGFKSAGRRLFRKVGVPTPLGVEGVRSVDDVLAAIEVIRSGRPGLQSVVIKHDDSGAGDGNVIVDLTAPTLPDEQLRDRLTALPSWYLADLARGGGVVEELIVGDAFASPSAQVDIEPSGHVVVLATHEQVLGGDNGQVYKGCRFPADNAYAAQIAAHARAAAEELAACGVVGRVGVDFVAARDAAGHWTVLALEINLRKGGTTHPYCALRSLVPGRYDAPAGRWVAADGSNRAYCSTDNLMDPAWRNRPAAGVIAAVAAAGLEFDHDRGTGIVLHMLSGLSVDGRFGMTAIDRSPEQAAQLYVKAVHAVGG